MKNSIPFIIIAFICLCALNACNDNGMGVPLATQMKIESSSYNVSLGVTAADTAVVTLRWIDIHSPSYTLTLSNSENTNKVVLPDKSKTSDNNVRAMSITDTQIQNSLTQMQLTNGEVTVLNLTIVGTRMDGAVDSVSTTINVLYVKNN